MHKQGFTCNKYAKFTTEELLTKFKDETRHICKNPDEVNSFAERMLNYFIRRYGEYVK